MFKNILVAVDGSIYTDAILSAGMALAKAFHSRIYLITVADVRVFEWATAVGADGFVPIVPSGLYQDESKKILDEKCEKILEKSAKILQEENLDFEVEKLVGSPVDAIIEKSRIADLVLVGKRGEFAKWDKKTLGATTEAITRSIFKPLLVVEKEYKPFKKILVGYDGSSHANHVLMYASHIAEALTARISVLCIGNNTEWTHAHCEEAKKYLQNYNVKFETLEQAGQPEKEIVRYAEQEGCELIAIGAHGHSRIHEAILGCTTEHILRFSTSSVLLAK